MSNHMLLNHISVCESVSVEQGLFSYIAYRAHVLFKRL